MLEIKGNLCKSTAKHQNFRLRRAISTEITTKYIVLSHLNPPEGRKFFWRCFSKKIQNQKKKNTGENTIARIDPANRAFLRHGTAISYQHLDSTESVRTRSRGSIPRTGRSCVTAQLSHTSISIAQSQ